MTKPKKPQTNPIEKAIGDRANPPAKLTSKKLQEVAQDLKKEKVQGLIQVPLNPSVIPDEPSRSEMLTLEELNHRTVDRLQEQWPEEPMVEIPITTTTGKIANVPQAAMPPQKTLVSKPENQPVTKTSSQESQPPQKTEADIIKEKAKEIRKQGGERAIGEMIKNITGITPSVDTIRKIINSPPEFLAEDVELTALRKYILEDGFNEAAVAFHIVTLCSQPLVTTSTTTWNFADRAMVPEMVLSLLNKCGYLEGIWPSLKIIMSSNAGNSAWAAGIATTIAFFDTIRMLPVLEEIKRCSETEQK